MPESATDIFGAALPLAQRYVEHLATTGIEWGLIGPRELPRLWSRHVLNCAAVHEVVAPGSTVIDVGSGAGLPGIPMALADLSLQMVLVEPLERRCQWLAMVLDDLAALHGTLLPVTVRRGRAEEMVDLRADVVCSRAVAALPKLLRWCAPLAVPGGRVVAMKGDRAAEEVEAAQHQFRKLGVEDPNIHSCGAAYLEPPTRVVTVRRIAPTSTKTSTKRRR